MFRALLPLLEQVDLTLHLHLEDNGDIRVVAVPNRTSQEDDPSLFTPITMTAPPAELDDYFPIAISEFSETRKTLAQQLAEAKENARKAIEAAKAAANKSNKRPMASSNSTINAPTKRTDVTSETFFNTKSRNELLQLIRELLPSSRHIGIATESKDALSRRLSSAFADAYSINGTLDGQTIAKLKKYAEDHKAVPTVEIPEKKQAAGSDNNSDDATTDSDKV